MPEEMTLAEFQQRYTSQKFVGSGGFAKVFKAFDEVNGYFVALKIAEFRPEHQHFTLQREVSLANQLPPHPNVARYDACYSFDMGLAGKQDIAVLKYYEHGNLEQFLCQNTLSESERRFLVKGILQGIDFLHRHDHLHRDLKAQNVLLHRENGMWQPKIIDFGLSRKVAATDSSVVNSSVGISYSYASPEQVQNLKIRKSTDLWAAGVLIYRIVAGELPFRSTQYSEEQNVLAQTEISTKIIALELPAKLNDLPEPYQRMIRRCLVVDPTERVQSAQELLSMLDGGTVAPPQPSPVAFPAQERSATPVQEALFPQLSPAGTDDKTVLLPRRDMPPPQPARNQEQENTVVIPLPPPVAAAQTPLPPLPVERPDRYVNPGTNATQILNRQKKEEPPAPAPAFELMTGAPARRFNWLWVLGPLLLLAMIYGAYLLVKRLPESPPEPVTTTTATPPPASAPTDWLPLYEEAIAEASHDDHATGHRETFTQLVEAGRIAIRNKQATDMLQRMKADEGNSSSSAHLLTSGHDEWFYLKIALINKDERKLENIVRPARH